MSEEARRLRSSILVLIAVGLALVAIIGEFAESGKISRGGVVTILFAVVVSHLRARERDDA